MRFDHEKLVDVIERRLTVTDELSRIGLEESASARSTLTEGEIAAALRDDVDRQTGKSIGDKPA